jgi:hypothetical protein
MSYEDFILSMAFYTFDVRDNKKLLAKNKAYRGLAANSSTAQSAYSANWNFSLMDDELREVDAVNAEMTTTDVERMFRPIEVSDMQPIKRFMTVDMATTGADNLVMQYWELYDGYGFLCKDIKYSIKNTNREAVIMMVDFRDKHRLEERDMIIDVQGFTFLRDCFPRANAFSGASTPTKRSKNQYRAFKDEASHLALEMVQNGFIHYLPQLADMRYYHQHMKREGATTVLRHMKFESIIFQFSKTPNSRITIIDKEKQHKLLKGMSPDLFDNVIILCGGTCYDCYRLLSGETGYARKKMAADDMFQFLNIDGEPIDHTRERKKIRNANEILNIINGI